MTWPTVAVGTTNVDAGTDSPATARADIKDALDKLNQMMAHVTTFAAQLLDDTTAAAARTTLGAAASGANNDITSLASPALAGATATTQSPGDNTTKVATTAFVTASNPAASASAAGHVELATTAETQTGSDTARGVTPAGLKGALLFSNGFESTERTVAGNTTLNIAHGLTVVPKLFQVVLRCTTAELGFSVGDEVACNFRYVAGVSVIDASADATNIVINYTGANTRVLNKTTQVDSTITAASWRFVARAWA
jgi:hypothetical protein